jgi:hypothetical protein
MRPFILLSILAIGAMSPAHQALGFRVLLFQGCLLPGISMRCFLVIAWGACSEST